MSPIKEWYPVSLKSQRVGLTPTENSLKDLCEAKRRGKIFSFPAGSASCVFFPFQNNEESTLFTSSGGIVVPFIDLNPFYFVFNNGQAIPSLMENLSSALGVEKISFHVRESTIEIVLDGQTVIVSFEKSKYFDGPEQNRYDIAFLILSAVAFLESQQFAIAKQEGVLIGEYLPQKAENVVAGHVLVLPGSAFLRYNLTPPSEDINNDILYPTELRLKSNNHNSEKIAEKKKLLGVTKPVVACWKNIIGDKV